MLIPALEAWRATKQEAEEEWRQKCSSHCEECATVELCITGHWAARICNDFQEGQKSVGTNSTSTIHKGYVKQTSEKRKVRRSGTFKSKFFISEVPTLWSLRTDVQEETARQERCARGDAWELARKIFQLKQEDKATFYSPSEECIIPAASTIKPEEREFCGRFLARACTWSARKTLTKPNWRPWGYRKIRRRWWQPTAKCQQKKRQRNTSVNWTYSWR